MHHPRYAQHVLIPLFTLLTQFRKTCFRRGQSYRSRTSESSFNLLTLLLFTLDTANAAVNDSLNVQTRRINLDWFQKSRWLSDPTPISICYRGLSKVLVIRDRKQRNLLSWDYHLVKRNRSLQDLQTKWLSEKSVRLCLWLQKHLTCDLPDDEIEHEGEMVAIGAHDDLSTQPLVIVNPFFIALVHYFPWPLRQLLYSHFGDMHLLAMIFQSLLGFLLLYLLSLWVIAATDIRYTHLHVDLFTKTFTGIEGNSSSDNGRTLWKFIIASPLFLLYRPLRLS